MNTFQLSRPTTNNNIGDNNLNNDKASFKESITGIEKYWNNLNSELDKKKKDVEELNRMYQIYNLDEFLNLIENINCQIEEINTKMFNIQKIMWDVRTRIIFSE